MGILPSKGRVIEEIVPLTDIDPLTCREKLKGDIDEHGVCLVRIRSEPDQPDKAELQRMLYVGRGAKVQSP